MILALPVKGFEGVRSLSPSRFVSAQECRLREVFGANRIATALPMSPAPAIGSVTHLIFQEAGEGKVGVADPREIERRWNQLVDEVEHKMAGDPLQYWLLPVAKSLPDYEVRRIQTIRRATGLTSLPRTEDRSFGDRSRAFGFELPVATADGLVRGRIDRVIRSVGGPVIQDFKTGNVYDARNNIYRAVRQEYEIQMRLYAALYFEVHGEWASILNLVPLHGESIPISYSRGEAQAALDDAKTYLLKMNQDLAACDDLDQTFTLASPQASVCSFCAYRPYCLPYQKS